MQTPDSSSIADKTGEISVRGHGVRGGRGPPCLWQGCQGRGQHGLSSLPPRGVPCLTLPQRHCVHEGAAYGGRKDRESE